MPPAGMELGEAGGGGGGEGGGAGRGLFLPEDAAHDRPSLRLAMTRSMRETRAAAEGAAEGAGIAAGDVAGIGGLDEEEWEGWAGPDMRDSLPCRGSSNQEEPGCRSVYNINFHGKAYPPTYTFRMT